MHSSKAQDQPKPYSIYTRKKKWFIVGLTSFAGLFSPLSSNIYFPAIPTLMKVFHKSTELINLTVTMYIVMQAIAPMFWGPISDHLGRRLIFISCLLILSLTCVGLALVPASDFWLLMLLRCIQAAGSASTIAIGAGVIGDISEPKERGGFYGVYALGPMIGPSIGPVIGGALTGSLGWRSIFWFTCISSSVCLLTMVLLLPETLRVIVGDGRIIPSATYRPIIPIIGRKRVSEADLAPIVRPRAGPPRNPLKLLMNADILLLLILNAIVCAIYYGFIASLSTLFTNAYPFLNSTTIGLCYLGIGGGMTIGSWASGRYLDWEYRRVSKTHSLEEKDSVDLYSFPFEQARLRMLPVLTVILMACCAGYGWSIQRQINIAAPLIMQILVGFVTISVMNSTQTLMIDLVPGQGSSITACNNLFRCGLTALLVSVIDLIIRSIGIGWTYVLFAGLAVLVLPMTWLLMRIGPKYRKQRVLRTLNIQ